MAPNELINRYRIRLDVEYRGGKRTPTGKLYIAYGLLARENGDWEKIVSAKEEIKTILLREFEAEQLAAEEREAKINAIPGLKEIQAAKTDLENWQYEFEESFKDVGGMGVRPKPQYDFEELYRKYPRASAYLKAEAYSRAANYAKASAGKKALERIINGEDCDAVLEEMESEWSAYCDEHIWD